MMMFLAILVISISGYLLYRRKQPGLATVFLVLATLSGLSILSMAITQKPKPNPPSDLMEIQP